MMESAAELIALVQDPDYTHFETFESGTNRVAAVMSCLVGMDQLITREDLAAVIQTVWPDTDVDAAVSALYQATILRHEQVARIDCLRLHHNGMARNTRRRLKRWDRVIYRHLHETLLERAQRKMTEDPSRSVRRDYRIAAMIYALRLGRREEYERLGHELMSELGREETNRMIVLRQLAYEAD